MFFLFFATKFFLNYLNVALKFFDLFLLLYVLFAQEENGGYCSIAGEYVVGNEVFIKDANLRDPLSRCEGRSVYGAAGNNEFYITLRNRSFPFNESE